MVAVWEVRDTGFAVCACAEMDARSFTGLGGAGADPGVSRVRHKDAISGEADGAVGRERKRKRKEGAERASHGLGGSAGAGRAGNREGCGTGSCNIGGLGE